MAPWASREPSAVMAAIDPQDVLDVRALQQRSVRPALDPPGGTEVLHVVLAQQGLHLAVPRQEPP